MQVSVFDPKKVRPTMGQTTDAEIRNACLDTMEEATRVSLKAVICGQLLNEKQQLLAHKGDGTFQAWLLKNIPEVPKSTAYRWMAAARTVFAALSDQMPVIDISVSQLLTLPDGQLSEPQREAKQLYFDFTKDKTIADCIRGAALEGDEPHRITRAHNGKTKGGSKGENRKDFPKFIANKLSDVSTHLESWDSMTATQRGLVQDHFERALGEWPKALLEVLRDQLKKELQKR